MLLRRKDCNKMEQDPTVDSSCIDTDLLRHDLSSRNDDIPTGSSPVNQFVTQAGSQLRSITGAEYQRMLTNHVCTVPQFHFQLSSGSLTPSMNSHKMANSRHDILSTTRHSVLVSNVTRNSSEVELSDNSNIQTLDQNDLNTSSPEQTQTLQPHALNIMDTSGMACNNESKSGQCKRKAVTLPSKSDIASTSDAVTRKYVRNTYLENTSMSIEDNRVMNTIEHGRNIQNEHIRADLVEHDECNDPSEYLQPAEDESANDFGVIGDNDVFRHGRNHSEDSEYRDFEMEAHRLPDQLFTACYDSTSILNTHQENIESTGLAIARDESSDEIEELDKDINEYLVATITSDIGSKSVVPESGIKINFEDFGSDIDSTEYQYSGWGIDDSDESITHVKQVFQSTEEQPGTNESPTNSGLLGISDRFCSLKTGSNSDFRPLDDWSSGGFSVSDLNSHDKNELVVGNDSGKNDDDSSLMTDKIDRTQLYLDFDNFSHCSTQRKNFNASLDNEIKMQDSHVDACDSSVSNHGKNKDNCMSANTDSSLRKSVYESLNRGMSCPSELVYNDSLHVSETLVIAEVFSPMTDESNLEDFLNSDKESLHSNSSLDNRDIPSVKRHSMQTCVQNQNWKRSRLFHQSLADHTKNVRFMQEFQSSTHQSELPSLPPRRNLPDLRRNSSGADGRSTSPGKREQPQVGQVDVPCKIVIAGKSTRPPLDNLLANDRLFEYYKKQLHGYPGWCPRETENTVRILLQILIVFLRFKVAPTAGVIW